jgi:type I restriction enzyme M protein
VLDTATKRRIDTARDILVGKVPDPKSQVEQITIALIYKFMDDMDAESEELGGKRKFFAGDFARYGWAKLMRAGLGGHETLNLYAEAIARMPENDGIPPLFRDIFKNAYLPYRDPETLRAFLKIIDEFTYDHSERLGDAFEYLLSVLGSQGDAGQFRTPRHIIDFIVSIVDPKKNETVLDPACGTAGFLISTYKHILKANADERGQGTLTPEEKARLARSFYGYDISPDMVRLSLVNMYLHGFTNPNISEYDTLTSEERWNEYFDVILANPPFMSPKGGIRPHRRFSVESKRSEVLFVDYMAEHLKPGGRAGIIVPEGIIFQSGGAYKQLRRMLVEDFLVAVVSLPAGVFQPYSGVKTSILILDSSLARKATTIGFFKVENDGFGLGAQRREIDKNDMPQVKLEIDAYVGRLQTGASIDDFKPTLGQIVEKVRIAANGDYNLSGERYRDGVAATSSWPIFSVSNVFVKSDQTVLPELLEGPVTYVGLENITQNTGEITGSVVTSDPTEIKSLKNIFKPGNILYGKLRPNLNKVWLADRNGICSTDIFVIEAIEGKADPALYAYLFRTKRFNVDVLNQIKGAQLPRVGWPSFAELQIPLPPLEVQQEIVAEIEGYQKVIDGARAVLDNYKPHISIDPEWPMVELGELCEAIQTGPFGTSLHQSDYVEDGIPVINPQNILEGVISKDGVKMVSLSTRERLREFTVRENDIIIGRRGEMGRCAVVTAEMNGWLCGTGCFVIRLKTQCDIRFAFFQISSPKVRAFLDDQAVGVTMKNLNQGILSSILLPLPPLATQQVIVAKIEAEQALVAANRELIERMERKIQAVLDRVWGEGR